MRTHLLLLSALPFLLAAGVAAQESDLDRAIRLSGDHLSLPGIQAAGDVLNHVQGPLAGISGATWNDPYLYVDDYADGVAGIYVVDPATGAQVGLLPTASPYDSWVGYDHNRGLFLTTNILDAKIRTYDGVSPTPVSEWDFPAVNQATLGIDYDGNRDVYWTADWISDWLLSISPVTGLPTGTMWNLAVLGATRCADVGFDEDHDVVLVGDRDTNMVYEIDPDTGALLRSYPAPSGTNNPRGMGVDIVRDSVWVGSWLTDDLWELDQAHEPRLTAAGLQAGATGTLTVSGCTRGDTVYFLDSLRGQGPAVVKGIPLHLTPPIALIGTATAGTTGTATLTVSVPGSAAGVTAYLQAVCAGPGGRVPSTGLKAEL